MKIARLHTSLCIYVALCVSLLLGVVSLNVMVPATAFADNGTTSADAGAQTLTTGGNSSKDDASKTSDSSDSSSTSEADSSGEETPMPPTGLKAGWNKIDDNWYYANKNGNAVTGWQKVGKSWYYLSPETGVMQIGWLDVDGNRYYLASSGAMATGWQKLDGKWYYFNHNGFMARDWKKVKKTWYYLDSKTGAMQTGWLQQGSTWYFLASSGAMKTGWYKSGSTWYYLKGSGAMATGWQKVGKTWYYLDPESGAMQTGWLKLGKKWYYLYKSGAMASDAYVGKYYLAKNGVWVADPWLKKANSLYSATNYVIIVDTKANWVSIYSGSKGNRSLYKTMQCTSGAPATPTVKGEFTVLDRKPSFGDGSYIVWNATRFYGGYFFHSVLYYPGSTTSIKDGRLGMNLSHGCIRLEYGNSRWIYNNIPNGTKVYVY